jgi:hypothetical protein
MVKKLIVGAGKNTSENKEIESRYCTQTSLTTGLGLIDRRQAD